MTNKNRVLTSPIINWLSIILQERFGLSNLKLILDGENISLRITNLQGKIVLPSINSVFFGDSDQLKTFFWDAKSEAFTSVLQSSLVILNDKKLALPIIKNNEGNYTITYDILGLCYWMLSRREELNRSSLDQHKRFPASVSHAYLNDYLERPIIDEWLHILGQVIQKQWPSLMLKKQEFSIKVSHDVDNPSRYGFKNIKEMVLSTGAEIIKRHNFKKATTIPIIWWNTKQKLVNIDPYNTFEWLMELSEKNDLKSAFYFFSEYTGMEYDAKYELGHPAIRKLLRTIHSRGHEIGLHPSYQTFQHSERIVRQAKKLKQICAEEGIKQAEWGGRMHFLQWEHPKTLNAWNDAGMAYDSTFGFADAPGFRCGTCFEYPAFDPIANKMLALRIRPLIAMECTIIDQRYMNLGYTEKALAKFLQLKNTCKKVGGCFTLLWHNDVFQHLNSKPIYQQILSD